MNAPIPMPAPAPADNPEDPDPDFDVPEEDPSLPDEPVDDGKIDEIDVGCADGEEEPAVTGVVSDATAALLAVDFVELGLLVDVAAPELPAPPVILAQMACNLLGAAI